MDVIVEPLSNHPEAVPVAAGWQFSEWGHTDPGGSLEAWTAGLARQAGADQIPGTLIALGDRLPVGMVCLVADDMPGYEPTAGLTPWIKGLYVIPAARRRDHVQSLDPRGQPRGRLVPRHVVCDQAHHPDRQAIPERDQGPRYLVGPGLPGQPGRPRLQRTARVGMPPFAELPPRRHRHCFRVITQRLHDHIHAPVLPHQCRKWQEGTNGAPSAGQAVKR